MSSNNKTPEQLNKDLLEAVAQIQTPLSVLAHLQLAKEFYSDARRQALYAEYEALIAADNAAYEALNAARQEDGLSWEQRVAQFGEDEARRQTAPMMAAFEARKATTANWGRFRTDHPLLVRLFEARVSLPKDGRN